MRKAALIFTTLTVALLCFSHIVECGKKNKGSLDDGPVLGGGGGPVLGGGPILGGGGGPPAQEPQDERDKKSPFGAVPESERCNSIEECVSVELQNQFFSPYKDCPLDSVCCPGDTSEDCQNITNSPDREVQEPAPFEKPAKVQTRKRRDTAELKLTLRSRRGIAVPPPNPTTPGLPPDWWRCDFTTVACCRTCRRTIPLLTGWYDPVYGIDVYPVQCITNHGVQLQEHVACLPNYCAAKKGCRVEWTYYTYLVTTVPPEPNPDGHCHMGFIPTFFSHPKMLTHCHCDENPPYKKKGRKGKKG